MIMLSEKITVSIPDSGILALLGYGVVFLGLISLMIVVTLVGKGFVASQNKNKAPAKTEPAPVAPAAHRRGTAADSDLAASPAAPFPTQFRKI